MSHVSSSSIRRPTRELVDDPETIALLHAVAAGRITDGGQPNWLLDGQPVGPVLYGLAAIDQLITPNPAPPALTPRGRLVLAAAHGEIAIPLDDLS